MWDFVDSNTGPNNESPSRFTRLVSFLKYGQQDIHIKISKAYVGNFVDLDTGIPHLWIYSYVFKQLEGLNNVEITKEHV